MSKLGFDRIIKRLDRAEKEFLTRGMKLAQKEFSKNFKSQSDAEKGTSWLDVERGVPPPILDVSGELVAEATSPANIKFSKNFATLTIDPIDERGRGYAEYHQEGINQYRTKDSFQRRFVTQSSNLDREQKNALIIAVEKAFNGRGNFI